MKRLLKRIVLKLLYHLTKEEGEDRDYTDLSRHELNALAVRSLVGIDHSLRYLVKQSYDGEDCEDEESAIPYPENNRPREMIV